MWAMQDSIRHFMPNLNYALTEIKVSFLLVVVNLNPIHYWRLDN